MDQVTKLVRIIKNHCLLLLTPTIKWKGVASGVCYLHEHEPIIVHGDLKPVMLSYTMGLMLINSSITNQTNVLIDDQGNAKICDFGLVCILLDEGHTGVTTTTPFTGTERYLAPELLTESDPKPSTGSDVWALGCIGLEVRL